MEKKDSRTGSSVLYNPYLDRSRASSLNSVKGDRSVVEKEEISDDSEELGKPVMKVEIKKSVTHTRNPLMIAENKQMRGGFFSNMKQIMDLRKPGNQSVSRGATPTRKGDTSVRSNDVSMIGGKKLNSNTETSITAGKVSLAQFMDNLATQKKINTSKLTNRKFSSPNSEAMIPGSSLKVSPNVPKGAATISRESTMMGGGFAMNLKINRNEFSNLATDLSSMLA